MKKIPLIFIALLSASGLHAQQPQTAAAPQATPRPELPPGPILNRAPDFSQWTISYKSKKPPEEKPARASNPPNGDRTPRGDVEVEAKRMTVVKTGQTRLEKVLHADGKTSEKWYVGVFQLTKQSGWGSPLLSSPANPRDQYLTDYSRTDFPGFEWASAKNYLGTRKVGETDCLIFTDRVSLLSAADLGSIREGSQRSGVKFNPDDYKSDAVVCIDVESRLPVLFKRGDETRVYTFGTPPTQMLEVPPEFRDVLARHRAEQESTTRTAGRPF